MPTLLLGARAQRLHLIPVLVRGGDAQNDFSREVFKYPDPRTGPYQATLSDFQGVPHPISERELTSKLTSISEVEMSVLTLLSSAPRPERGDCVLAIGSGLIENNLVANSEIELDYKHVVTRVRYHGGSGVNYAIRLSRMGCPVLPIISIGKDPNGREIQEALAKEVPSGHDHVRAFIEHPSFLCPGIKTSETYIAIHGNQRTTFTEVVQGVERFPEHCYERLADATGPDGRIGAVMLGHLYADDPSLGRPRSLTADIAAEFNGRALVFANFGVSQIRRGSKYWRDHLQNISVLQLTLQEAVHFFSDDDRVTSLEDMIRWFRSIDATVIITYDSFGAVAVLRGEDDPFDAHRFMIAKVVDKTGAGDAFGSGIVHSLLRDSFLDRHSVTRALERARVWGAYACGSIGGSHGSPNQNELTEFEKGRGAIPPGRTNRAEPVYQGSLQDRHFLDRLRLLEEREHVRHKTSGNRI